eukprot:8333203-Prorocentrum_lima.AAC.1
MTSSLVGSEMCIRDRQMMVTEDFEQYSASASILAMVSHSEVDWQILGPVSYTHLTLPTICSV